MRIRTFVVLLLLVLVAGCDVPFARQRYQLLALPDGRVYRLDNTTGAVHYVTPDGMHALSEGTPKLKHGGFYQMEDGKFLKYVGNGQFEKSDYAIRRVNY